MKNKKIILGLGTITALGAMSVGFIACVKEEKVKEIVEDKTKDLSKLKKDDLNDKFKTLEDKITALEKQLKEATNKKDIDSLSKQLLDKEIQKFEANIKTAFQKVKFKKKGMFFENEEYNTVGRLFDKFKHSSFEENFEIVNKDDLGKKITDDKFKLKIVAKGRNAQNSPLFVKEIDINFYDVLVKDDIIDSDAFANDSLKGFKNKEALEKKIKEITDSNDTKNSDVAKFEVLSMVNETDATIKVTMKNGKTIDEDTFVIKGAIARKLDAKYFQNFKPSNKTTKKEIENHLNQHPDFIENKLTTEEDIEIILPTADDKKATKDQIGEILIKAKVNSKRVQGELKLEIPKLEKLDIDKIKNNAEVQKIKNLKDLAAVNEALEKIKIDGVKELKAQPKEDSTTDVVITITPEESTHYIDDKDKKFIIPGAIKQTKDKEDQAKDKTNSKS